MQDNRTQDVEQQDTGRQNARRRVTVGRKSNRSSTNVGRKFVDGSSWAATTSSDVAQKLTDVGHWKSNVEQTSWCDRDGNVATMMMLWCYNLQHCNTRRYGATICNVAACYSMRCYDAVVMAVLQCVTLRRCNDGGAIACNVVTLQRWRCCTCDGSVIVRVMAVLQFVS